MCMPTRQDLCYKRPAYCMGTHPTKNSCNCACRCNCSPPFENRADRLLYCWADRITANGDTANKIGTYGLALLAKAHNVPFFVAAPSSTFDLPLKPEMKYRSNSAIENESFSHSAFNLHQHQPAAIIRLLTSRQHTSLQQ